MATDQRYVDTDVSPGGDGSSGDPFASLSEWEATVGASNSATDDYIVDCCGVTADSTSVVVDFANNISSGSITIRGNRSDPAGFYAGPKVISDQHYRMDCGNTFYCARLDSEDNITVDGIQAVLAHTGSNAIAIRLGARPITVRNCRLLNTSASDLGIGTSASVGGNNTRTIENNLVVGFDVHGISCRTSNNFSTTWHVRHNTVYGDGAATGIYLQKASSGGSPTFNVYANAVANCGTDIDQADVGSGTVNREDNASESGGSDILISSPAAAWTSPGTSASSDFTVKDTSSPLYNAVNPTLVTDDITGFTRDGANHDAGCFEFQAGGGAEGSGIGDIILAAVGSGAASEGSGFGGVALAGVGGGAEAAGSGPGTFALAGTGAGPAAEGRGEAEVILGGLGTGHAAEGAGTGSVGLGGAGAGEATEGRGSGIADVVLSGIGIGPAAEGAGVANVMLGAVGIAQPSSGSGSGAIVLAGIGIGIGAGGYSTAELVLGGIGAGEAVSAEGSGIGQLVLGGVGTGRVIHPFDYGSRRVVSSSSGKAGVSYTHIARKIA